MDHRKTLLEHQIGKMFRICHCRKTKTKLESPEVVEVLQPWLEMQRVSCKESEINVPDKIDWLKIEEDLRSCPPLVHFLEKIILKRKVI